MCDHPSNASILALLKERATPAASEKDSAFVVDGYELHTHPDLHERLVKVAQVLPEPCDAFIYGYGVLVTGAGMIFALAYGMDLLAFRLSQESRREALQLEGRPQAQLGPDWVGFDAWNTELPTNKWLGDLRYWCEESYRHALGPSQA